GKLIPQGELKENTFIIEAGTKRTDAGLVSNGGRVLLVGGIGKTLQEAREKAYDYLTIFDGNDDFFYRKDIAKFS
ncbi:MAG: phosphoribosylamine--glycine ligase, partial [Bacilli bacterium]|nr:phosphoribosylamine--glycine ligase [Bacilli bacterium]